MIRGLEFMTDHNFNLVPNITSDMVLKRSVRSLSTAETQEKLQGNEKRLGTIQKSFKNIGLSKVNILVRKSEKIIKKFNLHKTAVRLSPYGLILLYMIYVTRTPNLESVTDRLPGALAWFITSIKSLIGTAPYVKQESSDAEEVQDRNQFEPGSFSNAQDLLQTGNFLKIEIEPILKWAPATFLLGLISKDLKDLTSSAKKKISNLYSKLKNEKIDEDTSFDKPSLNHESLDLFEIPEFKNLKNYFKYKKLFDLAKHSVDKSFLFIGQQETGYHMSDILCAQLSKELNKDCRLVHINASNFAASNKTGDDKEDKLSEILKDAKKNDISCVVIDDIDWIYGQKERTLAKLDKFLDATSKKSNIIVIGLTDKPAKMRSNSKNPFVKIHINDLNHEQRVKFLKAQLKPEHAGRDLDIETIAKQTENCNLTDLKKIVQNAYTISYGEHKPLNKQHLALSVAQLSKKSGN